MVMDHLSHATLESLGYTIVRPRADQRDSNLWFRIWPAVTLGLCDLHLMCCNVQSLRDGT